MSNTAASIVRRRLCEMALYETDDGVFMVLRRMITALKPVVP